MRQSKVGLLGISLLALVAIPAHVESESPQRSWYEAQAWWMPAHTSEFQRVHLGTYVGTQPVAGVLELDVRVLLSHLPGLHNPGTVRRLDALLGDDGPSASLKLRWHPTEGDEAQTFRMSLDTMQLPDGWHPLYLWASLSDPRGQRRYVLLRTSVQVSNGSEPVEGRHEGTVATAWVENRREKIKHVVTTESIGKPSMPSSVAWVPKWQISEASGSATLPHTFSLSVNPDTVSGSGGDTYANEWHPPSNPFDIPVHLDPGSNRVFGRTTGSWSTGILVSALDFSVENAALNESPVKPEGEPTPTSDPPTEPNPTPDPEPLPEPDPTTEPRPEPEPSPTSDPSTEPDPAPEPEPLPEPDPTTEPTPEPESSPTSDPSTEPDPAPEPGPLPEPDPTTEPTPEPEPSPTSDPPTEPDPAPDPAPEPEPSPEPDRTTPAPPPAPAEDPEGSSVHPAVDFYGLPWTGAGVGELRIKGAQWFWISIVMPYDGDVASFRQYLNGRGTCSYGCGDGGVIRFGVHRDQSGRPGPEVTFATVSASRIAAMRANTGGRFDDTRFDQPITVRRGERIWLSASNVHANPTDNYIALNPFHLASRSSNRDRPEPVTSLDPRDQQLTLFDRNLELLEWKQHSMAVYYSDGRVFGNGYTTSIPRADYSGSTGHWSVVSGPRAVRQRFTPDRDLSFERVDLRVHLASGSAPLTVTIRQGGTVVATGSASSWVQGGWGYTTEHEWRAMRNAQWGAITFPRAHLQAGVEAEIELSTPAGTEYQVVGLRYGSNYMPGSYHRWPAAEFTGDGSTWSSWRHTEHLSFFFRLES